MNFNGYTLISDLDGTLLDKDKNISEKNLEAIDFFKKQGGKFTIATGRAPKRVGMYKGILETDIPAIFSNGISIAEFGNDKILWCGSIDNSVIEIVRDINKSYPEFGLEIFSDNTNYFINVNKYIEWQIDAEGINPEFCSVDEITLPCQKVLIATDVNFIDIYNEKYSDFNDRFDVTRSDEYYYEIGGRGINKGTAMYKLKEFADFDLDKTICIGDNLNDLEFVKNASIGAAVSNANETVKANADIIVNDNNNSAIYDLIDKLYRS